MIQHPVSQADIDEIRRIRERNQALTQAQINDMIGAKTRWVARHEHTNIVGETSVNIFDEFGGKHIARVFLEGDGHLIAAAPLMLETLRDLHSYLEMKLVGDLRQYDNNENHAVIMTTRRKLADITAAIACATNGVTPADLPPLEIEQ